LPESTRSSKGIDSRAWVTVLAGGIGSRFWPASTPARPKQLLPLASDQPLIVDTVERARALVSDDRIRILAGAHLASPFQSVLGDLPHSSYWIEPRARGTAPVLAWAAWKLARLDPNAVMVSLHADHLIDPIEGFRETVAAAVEIAAREELLLSIGVVPDRVETGYGYVEPGDPLVPAGAAQACRVSAFHEKPDAATAQSYVDAGYLWNTGIFVWKASVLLQEIERHAPEVAEHLHLLEQSDTAFFDAVPVSVIDRAVMERSQRVATVRAGFTWDDVGSWEALSRTRSADAHGNVGLGSARTVGGSRNIVYAEAGRSVVVLGADDLIVVQSEDTTMVMPRARALEMKDLLARMEGGNG
jgi:mannose-1-phosphate guanylyltransferase